LGKVEPNIVAKNIKIFIFFYSQFLLCSLAQPFLKVDSLAQPFPKVDSLAQPFPKVDSLAQPFPKVVF
jgi:hypothetical protein